MIKQIIRIKTASKCMLKPWASAGGGQNEHFPPLGNWN